jgi:class 3 adenylate cyclase
MRCRHCKSDNPDPSRFCDNCGESLALACSACRTIARAGARFCGNCGTRLAADTPPPPPPPPPPTLYRHIDEGERKLVTVLFADIRGSTSLIEAMDPEQAMGLLDPAVQAMVGAVQRFGGTVNRVQGDGIMALFGAPVASEDHAVRACLAAQAILAAIAGLHAELEVRVGLNSGDVVIRSVGQDPSDYDAVGVTVHLAHRMETAAKPGTVCLTGRTALMAHGTVDLENLGPRQIAGIAEPVEVFRLLSAYERPAWDVRAAAGTMTRFVGRDSELQLMESALGRAWLGRGQVVTLTADAGIGKSRLVHEFLKKLTPGAWTMIRAAGISHGEGTPYRLAADILRAWLGVQRSDARADVARKLTQALLLLGLSDTAEAAPLESLLDLPVTDPDWATLSAEMRRERMLPSLRQVMLRESAVRPLLLLIEDLHWSDRQSETLVEALVDGLGGARLLVLVTTRPTRRPNWATRGNRSYCVGLQLGPLEREAAEALLGELLAPGPELAELRARIISQADGTPLFLEELSRALIEQGVVVAEPSSLRLTRSMREVQIPASVQAILANRIDQLDMEPRRLLQVAAVIGKEIPRDILTAVADLSETMLGINLAVLQAAEFIYEISRLVGPDYTFKHALTQTVAYEGMLRRQRRDLHARVLGVMEALAADRADELTEVLADHAIRGEVWDRAATLVARAGSRATARSAWTDAVRFYDQALDCLGRLPENRETLTLAIDVRLGLRVALAPILQIARVRQMVEEASGLAERLGDISRMMRVDISRCLFLSQEGNLAQAIVAGRRAQQAARTLGDPSAQVSCAFALGQTLWFAGDFAEAIEVMEECLPLVRGEMRLFNAGTTGTASVLLLTCLSKTHALRGDFAQAQALAEENIAIAEETRKPYDLSYARLAKGFAHLLADEPTQAIESLEAALAAGRAAQIGILIPSVARYLGRAYVQTGRVTEAHRLLAEALATARASDMVMLIAWLSIAGAQAHAHEGDFAAAETHLGDSLALSRTHGFRPSEAMCWMLRAELHLQHAAPEAAAAALAKAEALVDDMRMLAVRPALQALRGRMIALAG